MGIWFYGFNIFTESVGKMVDWYDLDEKERIKSFYSKYTIKDFWDWWCDENNLFMEVRTTDWKVAKHTGEKFNLMYSHTGVIVTNYLQLKNVIAYLRDKHQIWFGVQPRKYGYSKYGYRVISGGDNFVECLKFIFIDIDRKTKIHPATNEELKECDIVAEEVIKKFKDKKWCKSYIKIASGNGVQILIKLDIPIKMPEVEYSKFKDENDKDVYAYIPNKEFKKTKQLLLESVGKNMMKYVKRFCKDNNLDVEIDKAGFKIAQVAAMPVTKNFKFGGFRWRGIIRMEKGVNDGLSDYVYAVGEKAVENIKEDIFGYNMVRFDKKKRLIKGKLRENVIIKFMLENKLPHGEINNKLWFQVKCLLRDYKINLNSKEFRLLHRELEAKHGPLTMNIPSNRFNFDENIVNRFCINNGFPPFYDLWPKRRKPIFLLALPKWKDLDNVNGVEVEGNDIVEDMKKIKKQLLSIKNGTSDNIEEEGFTGMICYLRQNKVKNLFMQFVSGCINKYGKDKTKYYYNYLFDKYFNYE